MIGGHRLGFIQPRRRHWSFPNVLTLIQFSGHIFSYRSTLASDTLLVLVRLDNTFYTFHLIFVKLQSYSIK